MARLMSLAILVLAICLGHTSPAADKPNIVVMLIDDMGVMDTSVPFLTDASGNPVKYPLNEYYRTPSMERLAKQGTGNRQPESDEHDQPGDPPVAERPSSNSGD